MGGQACVFYGAAQFSKDVDLALLASEENFSRVLAALRELHAKRIAVPRFDPALLARGHAVHFRCQGGQTDGLRVDLMTRLRGVAEFNVLWERRTTIKDANGDTFELLSLEDLVLAKKTQREKDWPIIDALIEGHYRALGQDPTPERVSFWLSESRNPERLLALVKRFPTEANVHSDHRPLLQLALEERRDALLEALDKETRAEQAKDRAYWVPLRAEFESFRRAEREGLREVGDQLLD
jgi:hypothetical protein